MEPLLALGTVVWVDLGDGIKTRLVIVGYYPHDKNTDQTYDYSAVMYPWGMQMNQRIQMLDRTRILSVVEEGYLDEDGQRLTIELPEALGRVVEKTLDILREKSGEKDSDTNPKEENTF